MVGTINCTKQLFNNWNKSWAGNDLTVKRHETEKISPPVFLATHEGIPFNRFLNNHDDEKKRDGKYCSNKYFNETNGGMISAGV